MDFDITPSREEISYEALQELFIKCGWGDRGGSFFLKKAFLHSNHALFAITFDRELIGCIRALSDGVYYATIHDLVVDPAWQKRGVGTALLKTMMDYLRHIPTVLVPALPESTGFYQRLGFTRHRFAMARFLSREKQRLFDPPEHV